MKQLIKNIEQWAEENNLIYKTKSIDTSMELFINLGRVADAVCSNGSENNTYIGNIFLYLVVLCKQMNKPMNWERYESAGAEWQDTNKELTLELVSSISDFIESYEYDQTFDDESLYRAIGNIRFIANNLGLKFEECAVHSYNVASKGRLNHDPITT